MSRKKYVLNSLEIEKLTKGSKFVGSGHHGRIYLMPNGKIIKIFIDKKTCKDEGYILNKVNGSNHFPKVYETTERYIIRDYVEGDNLKDYIKKYKLDKLLTAKLVDLILSFKQLGFSKLDIRCKDIYVTKDGSLKVIDPKKQYIKMVSYPRHLMKGLKKLGVLEDFLKFLGETNPDLYQAWKYKFNLYWTNREK